MESRKIRLIAAASMLALGVSASVFAQQSAPVSDRATRAQEHFKTADTDKDGFISRAEAEKSMPRLTQHFDALDTNKDGKLSPDELKAGFAQMRSAHRGHHDGMHMPITREELIARHQQMLADFDAADANKDGKLSQEEMKVFRDKHRAERPQRGNPPPAQK